MSNYLIDEVARQDKARVALRVLHAEWASCTSCALGVRRVQTRGAYVAGTGRVRGIMFVGGSPGWQEEKEGRPFANKAGELLRLVIRKLGIQDYYFTTAVTCRSCVQRTDEDGTPRTRILYDKRVVPELQDKAPTDAEIEACLPRLHEEIYLVDPIVIVGIGAVASSAVAGGKVKVDEHGTARTIEIPGRGWKPVVTAKRGLWGRKIDGEFKLPITPNMVRYTMIPALHPATVLPRQGDKSRDSLLRQFVDDIKVAAKLYEKYLEETFGTTLVREEVNDEDVRYEMAAAEAGNDFDPAEYVADQGE